jgi:hypothetical protein
MTDFAYTDSELQMDTQFILCIEECDDTNLFSTVDTRLFIGWDLSDEDYFVRGRRQDTRSSDYVPYAFRCESARDLYDFISFVMGESRVNVILYNFNNMDKMNVDEGATYEFFEENIDKNYEVAGYDDCSLKKSEILKYLRFLRNTYNWETVKR